MRVPSAMPGQGRFAQVPRAEISRSQFNRTHTVKTAFDGGALVPVFVDEVLPGDTYNLKMTAFGRTGTLVTPIMDNLYLDSFFFFVPYRLIWSNWEKFNGAQDNPGDSTSFTVPQQTIPSGGYDVGTVMDYMGVPVGVDDTNTSWSHSALPLRAYKKIWNEWFRDENLQDSVGELLGDGPDTGTQLEPYQRCKRPDYFTSSLPWAQKGTAVDIPFTGTIDVTSASPHNPKFKSGGAGSAAQASLQAKTAVSTPDIRASGTGTWASGENLIWDDPNLEVDVSQITGTDINTLRQSFQIQKMLERDARGGTRYIEVIKAHFGVVSPDARLQRTEYLGGGKSMINVSPVAQTSESGTTDLGDLAAYGTVVANDHGFVKSFTEHGIVIGVVNVRADLTYSQGLDRFWSRSTRYDFFWPALQNIGEQSVLNQEIYLIDGGADDDVWGYQERYAEYRYKPSKITGKMRPGVSGTLDIWHLSQEFSSRPALDDTFIQDDPPLSRVLAAGATEPEIILDAYFDFKCARPMSVYGVPGLIDHF